MRSVRVGIGAGKVTKITLVLPFCKRQVDLWIQVHHCIVASCNATISITDNGRDAQIPAYGNPVFW